MAFAIDGPAETGLDTKHNIAVQIRLVFPSKKADSGQTAP